MREAVDAAPGLLDLLHALRLAGLAVGPSEAIDATALLIGLAAKGGATASGDTLRAMLRSVLCKRSEERETFDAAFDRWWQARQAAQPAPAPPPVAAVASLAPKPAPIGLAAVVWAGTAVVVVAALLWSAWQRPAVVDHAAPAPVTVQ